ncbi:hypothetical protein GCM10009624_34970 [Gordonia sinesedis]
MHLSASVPSRLRALGARAPVSVCRETKPRRVSEVETHAPSCRAPNSEAPRLPVAARPRLPGTPSDRVVRRAPAVPRPVGWLGPFTVRRFAFTVRQISSAVHCTVTSVH